MLSALSGTVKLPIYDNHMHMNPRGRNILAAKEFEDAGGTGFTLVNLPYEDVTLSEADDFMRQYRITLSQAAAVRERTELTVNVAVGPYPVLLIKLAERFGTEAAERMMMKGMDIAASLVSNGEADAIGEIGRPHFPVNDEIGEASERILTHGMELARECSCPVVIHSESAEDTMHRLRSTADTAGLDPGMVIKHLSPPLVLESENMGIMPSVAASRSAIREALSKGTRFMLETDHIDDPDRPGVVLPPATVPRRIKGMVSSGEMSEETVWKICHDIPSGLYGRR
jgi:TatD-related deoxyribonuclease